MTLIDLGLPTIEGLCDSLRRLQAGHRAWFWFCPILPDALPPLVLSPFRDDPTMQGLIERTVRLRLPPEASITMGMASVNEAGRLQLGGPSMSRRKLGRLAQWTAQHVGEHPDLARLRDAVFVDIGDNNAIKARHADPALWDALPAAIVPGSIGETAHRLSRLRPGRTYWFWLTDRGPGDRAFLALGSARSDEDGAAFAQQVAELRRRATNTGHQLQGTVQRTDAGTLVFSTEGRVDAAAALLRATIDTHHPQLGMLEGARMLRTREGQFIQAIQPAPPPELSRQSAILAQLRGERAAWFWFTDAGKTGAPVLLLARERDALQAAARAAKGRGQVLRGQLRTTKQGWLHFRASSPFRGFVPALAGWVQRYRADWPGIERLRDARLTVTDKNGDTVERQRDDGAWTFLS